MQERAKVVAVIPARGGSKGIPRKNIMDLCGMPLLGYSIRVALQSRLIDRVIVSTDSEEVADVARSLGAEVPFLRPVALAGDTSLISEAEFHTLNRLREENYFPSLVVDLYPTHPFRTVGLVDELIGRLLQGYSPVCTVRRVCHDHTTAYLRADDGLLRPLLEMSGKNVGQRHYYRQYGLFVGRHVSSLDRPYVKVVDDPISLIDIDTMNDFRLAEYVISRGLFDFQTGSGAPCT